MRGAASPAKLANGSRLARWGHRPHGRPRDRQNAPTVHLL